jgi:parallel beta-helix repeat protein
MRNFAVALAATTALAPVGVAVASHHDGHRHSHGPALWASPSGTGTACTYAAPCALSTALGTASSGATVRAMKGTYTGGTKIVTTAGTFIIAAPIATPVNLVAERGAVIDATGDTFGVAITGSASGTTVRGFTIENAQDTGIVVVPGTATTAPALTPPVTDITIADNTLHNNGTNPALAAQPGGWGIHLESVTDSTVVGNRVYGNGGGVYLTDEVGPNDHNRVIGNRISGNVNNCGITLAGHVAAVDPVTLLPPAVPTAGVFDNLVADNVVNGNGTVGQGAGILMGGGALDAGVYGNVIRDNRATGNGLAGVVIHLHGPGDLNGNVIVGNRLGKNNVSGDPDFTPADLVTTGILVDAYAPGAISGTVIKHNKIRNNVVGIWTLNVSSTTNTIAHNWFAATVTTPILAH